MSNEATSLPIVEHTECTSLYEVVSSIQTVASMIQFLTTARTDRIALVTIALQFEQESWNGRSQVSQHERSTLHFLDALRRLVRKTDVVYLLGSTFYFILLGANIEGGSIVQSRLWDALLWRVHNTDERDILRPCSMSIGHSAYPTPYKNVHDCIVAASERLQSFNRQPERSMRKSSLRQGKLTSKNTSISAGAFQQNSHESDLPELARKLRIPYLSLLPRKLPEQVQQLLTLKLAQELRCYPLGRERGTLTVALANPQDHSILDRLRQETGLHIYPVLTHPQELQTALDQLV